MPRPGKKGGSDGDSKSGPPEMGGMPRRLYQATPLGRRVLAAWSAATTHLIPEFAR
jgi:hypothetical protein